MVGVMNAVQEEYLKKVNLLGFSKSHVDLNPDDGLTLDRMLAMVAFLGNVYDENLVWDGEGHGSIAPGNKEFRLWLRKLLRVMDLGHKITNMAELRNPTKVLSLIGSMLDSVEKRHGSDVFKKARLNLKKTAQHSKVIRKEEKQPTKTEKISQSSPKKIQSENSRGELRAPAASIKGVVTPKLEQIKNPFVSRSRIPRSPEAQEDERHQSDDGFSPEGDMDSKIEYENQIDNRPGSPLPSVNESEHLLEELEKLNLMIEQESAEFKNADADLDVSRCLTNLLEDAEGDDDSNADEPPEADYPADELPVDNQADYVEEREEELEEYVQVDGDDFSEACTSNEGDDSFADSRPKSVQLSRAEVDRLSARVSNYIKLFKERLAN